MTGESGSAGYWLIATAAFLVELALLIAGGIAGYRLVAGGWGWAPVAVVVVVIVAAWSRWMAPRSATRLPLPGRLMVGAVLFAAVAALLAVGGAATAGVIFGIAGAVTFGVTQVVLDH